MSGEEPQEETLTIEINGEEVEVRRLKNNALADVRTGRIVKGPDPPPFVDREKAVEANQRRQVLAQERACEGMVRAVEEKGRKVASAEEAWGVLVESLTKLGLKGVRESVVAVKFVGKAVGMISDNKQIDVQVGALVKVIDVDGILLMLFSELHPNDPEKALSEMTKYKAGLR